MIRIDPPKIPYQGQFLKGPLKHLSSMRLRIALLFSLVIAIVLMVNFAFLYYFLEQYFHNEAQLIINERIMLMHDLLVDSNDGLNVLKNRVEGEWGNPNHEPLWVKIQLPNGKILSKSKEFDSNGNSSFVQKYTRIKIEVGPTEYIDVFIKLDRSKEQELLISYGINLLLLLMLSVYASIYFTFKLLSWQIFPLLKMSKKMRHISLKSLHRRIDSSNFPSELVPVAQSFNFMLDHLQRSFEQISRFSGDIAHELRTPLNALLIKTDVMLEKPRSSEEYQELLESLNKDARGLSKLIDTLLFLSRTENPNRNLNFEIIHLNEEIKSLLEFYEPLAAEKQMHFVLTSEPNISIYSERSLFQRVLGNLIQNAIQHCNEGTLIEIKFYSASDDIFIEVIDNGPGISSEHLPFLFDRLYRVDPSRNQNSGGLGLGLSIVASIMKLHGGKATVESEPRKGTKFKLFFPHLKKSQSLHNF